MKLLRRIFHDPRLTLNFAFVVIWAILIPVAWWLDWLNSVVFVSLLSIGALLLTNLAAWLAELKLMREMRDKEK